METANGAKTVIMQKIQIISRLSGFVFPFLTTVRKAFEKSVSVMVIEM